MPAKAKFAPTYVHNSLLSELRMYYLFIMHVGLFTLQIGLFTLEKIPGLQHFWTVTSTPG